MTTSFGASGNVVTLVNSTARAVVVQSDGKILVAGQTSYGPGNNGPALVRYSDDGSIDPGFTHQDVATNTYSYFQVEKILPLSDGAFVIVGTADSSVYLAKYTSSGLLDLSFGSGGIPESSGDLSFGSGGIPESPGVTLYQSATSQGHFAKDAVLLDSGKILVTGLDISSTGSNFFLAQFHANGRIDSAFGTDGFITTTVAPAPSRSFAASIAIQTDGKILSAGSTTHMGGFQDMVVVRYLANGTTDSSFGASGVVKLDVGIPPWHPSTTEPAGFVMVQSTGKIVVAGLSANGDASGGRIAVARLNIDGSLDKSFGIDGWAKHSLSGTAEGSKLTSAFLSPMDEIFVVAGMTSRDGFLAKFLSDGILDTSFGVNGVVITDLSSSSSDFFYDATLHTDDKIIAVGTSSSSGLSYFATARYNANGTLDRDYDPPTAALSSNKASLVAGETATITFTLSESATDFVIGDVTATGGTLSALTGSGITYTATFTPTPNSATTASISVASNKFSDAAGNFNSDGNEANNTVTISVNTVQSGGGSGQSGGGSSNPICFARGTRIQIGEQSKPVETLTISNQVSTTTASAAIKWIGYQRRTPEFAQFQDYMPVKITAGALDDNVPVRDLYLSPDHAVLVDGHLIHAKALINGKTIVQMTEWSGDIEYYHIETEAHEIIYAEGVPCETFIDNVSREQFDNYAEYQALYPNTRMMKELPLPRVKFKRQLPTMIKQRLESRITELDKQHKG